MMALSQLRVGIHFCFKDIGYLTVGFALKIKNKIFKKTKVKIFELEDSFWPSRHKRLFGRSSQALQNTFLGNVAITFIGKNIKHELLRKNLNVKLKFEGEDSIWQGWRQRQKCSPCPVWGEWQRGVLIIETYYVYRLIMQISLKPLIFELLHFFDYFAE